MQQRSLVVLFTDLVGSTSARVALGDLAADVLRRDHDDIVRAACKAHDGTWIKGTGDGALVTFTSAAAAMQAAADVQAAVTARVSEHAFAVRIGITAGVVIEDDGDVFGMPVITAARLCDAADTAQILVNDDVVNLAGSRCALAAIPVGDLDLKGLGRPVTAHAVVWSATAPTSLKAGVRRAGVVTGHIPESITSFVGREAEVAELTQLVKQQRLLTILGPGGMGKTRLSLEVAGLLRDEFADGVWFVDLSPVTDERAVSTQILKTLGVSDTDEASRDQLTRYLSPRTALVVIDNCEHLIVAVAEMVAGLVTGATNVRLIATSRERLRVPGEHVWEIPAIGTADDSDDGIRLFTERAESVGAHLSDADRGDVVELCRLLDGMPLAIELAAARCRSVSPGRVLERLRQRPDQALGTARTGPDRQRSLDGLVAWSVDLLDDRERMLFARLSLFDGPFPLEAVEHVCTDEVIDQFDVIDLLSALVEKSLVAITSGFDGDLRYRLLFVIRSHATELLDDPDDAIRARLIGWLTDHVTTQTVRLHSPDQTEAHGLISDVHAQINAALQLRDDGLQDARRGLADAASDWLFFAGHHREALALVAPLLDAGDTAARARLWAWQARHARELGRTDDAAVAALAAETLSNGDDVDTITRLRVRTAHEPFDVAAAEADLALAVSTGHAMFEVEFQLRRAAAHWASASGAPDEAYTRTVAAALAAAQRLGDPRWLWRAMNLECRLLESIGQRPAAVALAERALELARDCPLEAAEVLARAWLANFRQRLEDVDQQRLALDEAQAALRDARRLDIPALSARAAATVAVVHANLGQYEEAIAVLETAAPGRFVSWLLTKACHMSGRHEQAVATYRASLTGADVGPAHVLGFAPFAVSSAGEHAGAVTLATCATTVAGFNQDAFDRREFAQVIDRSREQLTADEFDTQVARGEAMSVAEGAAFARELLGIDPN